MALTKVIGAGLGTTTVGTTITTADNTTQLTLTSTDTDANVGPVLNLSRDNSSAADNDLVGEVQFNADDDGNNQTTYGKILTVIEDASNGSEDGLMQIHTNVGGTLRDRIKITSSELVLNEESIDSDFRVESNGNANMLFVDGGNDKIGIGISNPASYDDGGDRLVVGDTSGRSGITIVTGTSNDGSINFADGTSGSASYMGFINYHHNTNEMKLATNGSVKLTIDADGHVTMPSQSAFLVQPSTPQSDLAATGNNVAIAFGTERFDQNSDFGSNTFTAPVTGKYQLSANIYLTNIDSAANYYQLTLYTSNRNYYYAFDVSSADADPNRFTFQVNVLADMDAGDTSSVMILQVVGTAQTDIAIESYFSGYLVA